MRETISLLEEAALHLVGCRRRYELAQAAIEDFHRQPPEMELEVQWQEHDLGAYPTTVLICEDAMHGALWEYIEKCEDALTVYENRPGNFLIAQNSDELLAKRFPWLRPAVLAARSLHYI